MRQLSDHLALAMHQARLYENLRAAYGELKTTQRVVMQQERLRAVGQMSSGIAHDVNNALSPIVMNAELILLREEHLSDQGRQYLRMIQLAAGDIEHTVGRLREFSHSREDQQERLPLDLNAEVQAVIDLTKPRWRDMPQRNGVSVEVATQLQPTLPAVLGVGSELREALANLILNAVDALPAGGTITIGTELLDRGCDTEGSAAGPASVALWVSDNGLGMDEETKAHCLEPFYTKKIGRAHV
jgi:signal transduction histidine kinase